MALPRLNAEGFATLEAAMFNVERLLVHHTVSPSLMHAFHRCQELVVAEEKRLRHSAEQAEAKAALEARIKAEAPARAKCYAPSTGSVGGDRGPVDGDHAPDGLKMRNSRRLGRHFARAAPSAQP